MNGKIRVSIVATSLKGSSISPDPRPILNIVNGTNGRNNNFSDNLFSKSNIEQNVVNSIDGATALKLDENYEFNEEQETSIDNLQSELNDFKSDNALINEDMTSSIPSGLSMESASYMENNLKSSLEKDNNPSLTNEIIDEYTPKLFSEDQNLKDGEDSDHYEQKDTETEQLFDQDTNEEEDFEIPAFLRKQKF